MGRQTISFVATDELAEWLENESENRMTTISSAAQQLLVEKYREQQNEGAEASQGGSAGADDLGAVFEENEDAWYIPDSDEYQYAVYDPDDRRRYYKTKSSAAEAIERWHVD